MPDLAEKQAKLRKTKREVGHGGWVSGQVCKEVCISQY